LKLNYDYLGIFEERHIQKYIEYKTGLENIQFNDINMSVLL